MDLAPGEIATALESFSSLPQRCDLKQAGQATIIDDSYNASPTSMRAALELLRDFDASGRRIVVQGSVAEMLRDQEPAIRVSVSSKERATQVLQSLPGITQVTSNGAYVEIKGVTSERIVAHLARHDLPPSEVVEKKSDLESLFLGVTQGQDANSESN